MKKRNSIRKEFNKLTEDEQQTLKLISILCTSNDGVSIRTLYNITGAEPHVFEKEIIALAKAGLLAIQINTIFPPTEVATVLDDVPIPIERFNGCISRLRQTTTLSTKDDLLCVRPYFTIAMSIMKYVLAHLDADAIDYEEFGKLLVNITRHYEIFAEPDMSVYEVHDLSLYRGLDLAKSKIDNKSILYARLCICQANLLLNGFWYDPSGHLLDEAQSIAHDDQETLASINFMRAMWHENYGQIGDCLAWAYQSWAAATNNDKPLKDYVAVYIGYQLALLDEFAASDEWVNKIDLKKYPQHHAVRVYYNLTMAMKCNDKLLVEDHLMRAECLINHINHQAPLKARVYYVRHLIYSKWGLNKEACEQYRSYANLLAIQYKSTEGAMFIYSAAEVDRLTAMGALIGAKHVIHSTLDFVDLSNSGYALSVKTDVCYSFVNYFLASGNYPLVDVYYNMGKEFVELTIPQEATIGILRNIFEGGEIPASVSGDSMLWMFEFEYLQRMMADRPQTEVKTQIDLLRKRFPSHQDELLVIAASLKESKGAIHEWHMAISTSEQSKRFDIALQCARTAVSQGLIWDGADFYNIILNTDGYKALNKYQKIDILLEVVQTFEQCGERGKAHLIWIQLEALAIGTSKLADVYQAHGNCSYDYEQYLEALECFDKCLAIVQSEEGLTDQRLSSLWAYKSSCHGALREYLLAYDSAVKAKLYFPLEEFEAFNLEYNHAFFAMALKKYEEARLIFVRAKSLARSEDEQQSVEKQLSILALKKEKREAYLKLILN